MPSGEKWRMKYEHIKINVRKIKTASQCRQSLIKDIQNDLQISEQNVRAGLPRELGVPGSFKL